MKTAVSNTILGCCLPILLLCVSRTLAPDAIRPDTRAPSVAPCFEKPDIVHPSVSVVAEALVRSPNETEPEAELVTVNAAADAVPDTSPAILSEDLNGPAEETTIPTTTTTTATTTVTTMTTSTPASLGLGGSFSNVISGDAGSGGGLMSLFGGTTKRTTEKKGPSGNFDQYLDNILNNLAKSLRQNGFDPLALGNMLQCRNCTLEGLSLIRRNGPSNLQYANRTLTVDAHLQLPALYISCFPCVQVVLMVPFTGMLEVALWDLQIYGKVVQRTERNAHPSLTEYKVLREGDLDVTLNGYGLLGPVTEMGFKILQQRQVSEIVREFVYDRIPNFIEEKLQEFNFPIGK